MAYSASNLANGPARLTATVAASCPILGVSIGSYGDPATVAFQPTAAATPSQVAAGQAAVNAFDWSDAASDSWVAAQDPDRANFLSGAQNAVADINTFLALAAPTNAQTLAFVQRLGQITRAIIKRMVEFN